MHGRLPPAPSSPIMMLECNIQALGEALSFKIQKLGEGVIKQIVNVAQGQEQDIIKRFTVLEQQIGANGRDIQEIKNGIETLSKNASDAIERPTGAVSRPTRDRACTGTTTSTELVRSNNAEVVAVGYTHFTRQSLTLPRHMSIVW